MQRSDTMNSTNGPNTTSNAQTNGNTSDGLLIQVDNGSIVAEPVVAVDHEDFPEGHRLIVNDNSRDQAGLSPVTELSAEGGSVDTERALLAAAAQAARAASPKVQSGKPENGVKAKGKKEKVEGKGETYADKAKQNAGTSRENLLDDDE